IRFELEKLKTRLQLPIGLHEKIEPGVPYESADPEVFRRWGMALGFPMMSENSEILGFLVLGEKKSGQRFSVEDVDLLNTVTTHAGLAIERITLQFKLMLEHAEAQRLEELNRLKSDFVSYVSHELRTPLTSIKMFAELLKTGTRKLDKKAQEYVRIIEGESDRLNRMVNNILDSARIERGVKQFIFTDVDLRKITGDVLKSMRYQLEKHRFRVELKTSKRPLPIHADPDAVAQALINLVSNAIKYSTKRKYLKIALSRNSEWTFCRVADRGSGISEEVLPHLFEKFYRDPSHSLRVQGVGLGLPLVKHIMEVHGGKVEVKSEIGKGSSFTLCFPLEKSDNQRRR
ncbi:MAG: sensor histidine kinase, partial [Bacteroidota bacterium]